MMKIVLPEFYLSFAFPELDRTKEPTQKDAEQLRLVTGGRLGQTLKSSYPHLKGFDLSFSCFHYKAEAKFQVYLEAKVSVFFEAGATPPCKGEVLDKIISIFDPNYRALVGQGLGRESPFFLAIDLKAGRLRPKENERAVGASPVRTSEVSVAFSLPQCHLEPHGTDYKALADSTREFYSSQLGKRLDTFQELEVSVGRAIFGRKTPNELHNVYIEWDIVAFFLPSKEGTIPGNQWLSHMLIKTDLKTYFQEHVLSLKQTPFSGATSLSIEQVVRVDDEEKKA